MAPARESVTGSPAGGAAVGSRTQVLVAAVALLALWTLGALLSLLRGQDASGDHRGSHVSAVWTLLHPDQDVALSPDAWIPGTVNIPWFLLALHAPAWAATAYLGALHATAIWLVMLLAWRLLDRPDLAARCALTVMCGAFAVVGATFRTEFATTFSDVSTALPLLGALLCLLWGGTVGPRRLTAAGLLLGVAFGLKMTNLLYVLACLTAVVTLPLADSRPRALLRTSAAAAVGAAVSVGYVWWEFLGRFGSPMFPFFNQLWRSPYAPPVNYHDGRFLPETPAELLLLPWRMASVSGFPSELPGRDPRWAVLASLLVLALVVRGARRRHDLAVAPPDPRVRFLLVFLGSAWAVWVVMFGIARYLLAIELVVGVVVVAVAAPLVQRQRWVVTAMAVLLVAATASTTVPSFARQPVPDGSWFAFSTSPVTDQPRTLVVFLGGSTTYLIAAFPDDARLVELPTLPGRLTRESYRVIAAHRGPVVTVQRSGAGAGRALLAPTGLTGTPECTVVSSNLGSVRACAWPSRAD